MYAYIKINYEMLIGNDVNSRKLLHILEIVLAVMILCVLAASQIPTRELTGFGAADKSIEKNTAKKSVMEDTDWFFKNYKKCGLGRTMSKNDINQFLSLRNIPTLEAVPTDTADFLSEEPAMLPQMPEEPEPPFETLDDLEALTPVQPEFSEEFTDQTEESTPVPDTDSPSSGENTDNQEFICQGFICDISGKIIGCSDVALIDGVVCLPSDVRCTGIAAGALDALGMQVWEIYIPANIVAIDEGAFDGLTELYFVQVHPDNPVYGSDEGYLYEK